MGVDPNSVCLFIPSGLQKTKHELFERIGRKVGRIVRGDNIKDLDRLPNHIIPIVGCTPALKPLYDKWRANGRRFIYWDRGYLWRVYATHLPTGRDMGIPMGYYRWHLNCFQMQTVEDVPDDRWKFLRLDDSVRPWNRKGDHIVIADTLPDYWNLFADVSWAQRTAAQLARITKRPITVRHKESKVNLAVELKNAHCLVTHGSIAAVESVVMGCPVFVDKMSAASMMGETDFKKIETPVYPDRTKWLHSLAYHQWHEGEMDNGTMWRMIR